MAAGVALSAAVMAAAMGGQVVAGDPETVPSAFAIDSRTLEPGAAFFAIVAARDGHDFAHAAVARGASVVVVSRAEGLGDLGAAVVRVDDTTLALQHLARDVRRRAGARVVAITGSAGKTTTKEAVAAVLSGRYAVGKNVGNLNNHLGLPLSLLELRHGADVGVMELGMNHAGEIRVLVGIAEPDVRVWTNVGDAHIGHFGSREAIASAKAEILEGARVGDCLVANADDPLVMRHAPAFAGRVVTFGLAEHAGVRAVDVVNGGLTGTNATVVADGVRAALHVPLVGRGNLSNMLAAVAVGLHMGVPLEEIVARVAGLTPARRRGEVQVTANGITVVDDSYNSSPAALTQSLEMLAVTTAARRVAVLGEMLELGELAVPLHEQCGRSAAAAGVALLITVGGAPARAMADGAVAAGLDRAAVWHADTSGEAAELAAAHVVPGDVVLVKGSRGVRTEVVTDRLTAVRG